MGERLRKRISEKVIKKKDLDRPNEHDKKWGKRNLYWIVIISFLGAALYFQTYNFRYTVDDGIYSFQNEATQQGLKAVDDLFRYGSMNFFTINPTNSGTYRPFTLLSFAIERQVFGTFNATNGHVINIVLYFLVLITLGLLLVKMFTIRGIPSIVPLLILLLYAVHPLHVEVVASVKSRDTLLCAFFSFFALHFWLLNYKESKIWSKIGIGILFFIALLSKEESITIVAVVFLIAYFFLENTFIHSLKETFPFLIAGIVYLTLRHLILDPPSANYDNIINNIIIGAKGSDRFATNLYIYLHYIWLLVFPHPLSWDYSLNQIPIKTLSNVWVLFSFAFFISIILVAFKGFKNKSILSFAILLYLSTFSIFSNFIPSITIGSTLAERFMFIPSLGFCILLVYGSYTLLQKVNINRVLPILLLFVLTLASAYSVKSYSRVPVWKDNISLGYSGIKDAPESWRTHMLLADQLRLKALKLQNPVVSLKTKKDTAQLLFKDAVYHFKKGFSIIGNHSTQPAYLTFLGECYLYLNDTISAKKTFLRSIDSSKSFFDLFKLGLISFNEKDYQSAINYYERALKADSPDFFSTYKNLGGTYQKLNDFKNAIKYYEKALEYGTSDEVISGNLSFCYSRMGNLGNDEIARQKAVFKRISETNPKDYFALKKLAFIAIQYEKNYPEAIKYYNQSIHADSPDFYESYSNLGSLYLIQNQTDKAIENFEMALKYGSSSVILKNLFLLWNSKENQEKMDYYQKLMEEK
jgi:tetratricopeptide (TPR) repeat protein